MKEPDLEEERLLASAKGFKLTLERRSMEDRRAVRAAVGAGRRKLRGDTGAGRPRTLALAPST